MKDMGKVIGALKAKYAGQMDFAKASGLVKGAAAVDLRRLGKPCCSVTPRATARRRRSPLHVVARLAAKRHRGSCRTTLRPARRRRPNSPRRRSVAAVLAIRYGKHLPQSAHGSWRPIAPARRRRRWRSPPCA